ncbi:MAG: hypothetical protein JJU36_01555 [Phycisphaeraceae bacterium]|nr:hypothetical protein [Phycisphaeraceae bacterium]
MSWVVRVAALVLVFGGATGTAWADAEKEKPFEPRPIRPTLSVQAELLAKAPTPTLEQISPYTDALVIYRYRVTRVHGGNRDLEDKVINVSHWGIYRGHTQSVTRHNVGRRQRLSLTEFTNVSGEVQTVFRSELDDDDADNLAPLFHDIGRGIDLPPEERTRWGYGVDLTDMMPLFFELKDQLKLVVLGDCQAWFANRAELYMADENRITPVSLSMCQQRSGLPFQKLMVDHYLVNLPKLEWVILTWNPRFVSKAWTEHGVQARRFSSSRGFAFDRENEKEIWKPREGEPLTVSKIVEQPRFTRLWSQRPWGWIYLSPDRHRFNPRGEVIRAQRLKGVYEFVPERWEIFESIVETLAEKDVKVLVYTTPIHPESANHPVKDKTGVDAEGYQDQVRMMREMEKRYSRHLFFYDLNNMGDNGLKHEDFENIDHVSASGALKVSQRVERFRLGMEERLRADTGE